MDAIYPSLVGKRVLVTGGATGIGSSLVTSFHKQNCKVAFCDIDTENGTALRNSVETAGNRIVFLECDLTKTEDVKDMVQKAVDELGGGIDVLVNNAANDVRHQFLKVTESDWHKLVDVNLKHQFFVSQSAIPHMQKQNAGVIINMGSGAPIYGRTTVYPVYTTCKAGIMGLTKTLAREFGPSNIRVNCIIPGWILTEKQKSKYFVPGKDGSSLGDSVLAKEQCLPDARIEPEDVASVALFLASHDARYITNQTFTVDAGWI